MAISSKLTLASTLLTAQVITAAAQPGADPVPVDEPVEAELQPPSSVSVAPPVVVIPTTVRARKNPQATTNRWGGGVRVTGLSGIGALPGVNYGGELSGMVRRDELFAELGLGWWKPEHTYLVTASPERVELKLDVWTLRAGWASMSSPLRAWALVEVGEMASARGMPGVVTRMMTGDVPEERQWRAVGGGLGVAWPMSDNARLFGMIEVAVPIARQELMLDTVGGYQSDPLAARSSAGLELGWR
jgi:hypothetical protein